MSYALAFGLQQAVFAALSGDAAVTALVGTDIFDAPPRGKVPALFVLLGEETTRDRSSKTSTGAMHDFSVQVVTDTAGFSKAKELAAAICDALIDADVTLVRGKLVGLHFRKARAVRGKSPEKRRIILTFRAFAEDD
ncbi:MAG: DUF3168 domain-containing protein [Rhodobacteraceae bacterium]|nr:DUF3168 domain-containing protein [Paracoccaceae bacterium]